MQTETNEPAPRKLYYVEGYFDKRTYYTAWIEADSKSEAHDIAEMIDEEDSIHYQREVKGYIETDSEGFSGDNYHIVLSDSANDEYAMPEQAKTRHAD